MLPGPMFSLEMVTSSRRTRYFIIRVLYAVVLLLCLLMIYNEASYSYEASIARIARLSYSFFVAFSIVQLILVLGIGPAMAAGTIAVERERKTIEHLFVTQLSNAEIVLGKLLARLLQIAYLVLVGLPILALAMLMGGIAPEALVMLFLLTLSTMLTVSILSITVSVWSIRSREAVVRAYLLIFVWLVIPLLVHVFNSGMYSSALLNIINDEVLVTNPFWVFSNILTWGSGVRVGDAWGLLGQMARNQGIVCLGGAIASTLAVRRVHLKDRSKGEKRRRRLQWLRPPVSDRPMMWKELFAEPAANKLGWLGNILMGIIVLAVLGFTAYFFYESTVGMYQYGNPNRHEAYLTYTAIISNIIGCGSLLIMAARAASSITSEKERDCWVSLLGTPLLPAEIISAKVLGNMYAMRWMFFLLAIIWGLAMSLDPGSIVPIGFQCATLVMLAFYVSALGVLYSLWCKTSLKAMAATLATAIFVGGGYMFCCLVCLIGSHGPGHEIEVILAGVIPMLLAIPYIAYFEPHFFQNAGGILAAYVIGLIGYGCFGMALYGSAIANFESLVGRVGRDFVKRPPPRLPAAPRSENPPPSIITAEAVEE